MRQLIVITTPQFFPDEGKILTRLFEEGLERLHLRKPDCKQIELEALLGAIPAEYYSRIALHDCFDLTTVSTYSTIGGVHLNRRNKTIPDGFNGRISRSCHNLLEIQEGIQYDYQFLSPVFQSISKEGYGSGFAPIELRTASESGLINDKVIALGGIDATTAPLIKDIGFGGVATLGAVWGKYPSLDRSDIIISQFKQIQSCI